MPGPQSKPTTPTKRKARSTYHDGDAGPPEEIQSDEEDEKPDVAIGQAETDQKPHKPKPGRIISNEAPLEDFERITDAEGDILLRKAVGVRDQSGHCRLRL